MASFRNVIYQFLVRQRELGKSAMFTTLRLARIPPVPSSHLACLDFLEKAEKGIIVLSVPKFFVCWYEWIGSLPRVRILAGTAWRNKTKAPSPSSQVGGSFPVSKSAEVIEALHGCLTWPYECPKRASSCVFVPVRRDILSHRLLRHTQLIVC